MSRYLNQETGLDYPTSPPEMGVIMQRFYDRCQELGRAIAERSLDPQHGIQTRGELNYMRDILPPGEERSKTVRAAHLVRDMFKQEVYNDYTRVIQLDGPIDDRRVRLTMFDNGYKEVPPMFRTLTYQPIEDAAEGWANRLPLTYEGPMLPHDNIRNHFGATFKRDIPESALVYKYCRGKPAEAPPGDQTVGSITLHVNDDAATFREAYSRVEWPPIEFADLDMLANKGCYQLSFHQMGQALGALTLLAGRHNEPAFGLTPMLYAPD